MQSEEFIIEFPKDYYMSWCVTTQADNTIKAKLYDDTTTYFNESRRSLDILPPMAINASNVNGNNLRLYIESSGSFPLKSSIVSYNISTKTGASVGKIYDICIEDYIENDYNDVCISLVAWMEKG
jgi:hypothetical protein